MNYNQAIQIANTTMEQLKPHCYRIAIAGSLRRKRLEVKDIEIVCIPKHYEVGFFESGIATVVNRWQKVKGELPCKYTQRILPEGIKLDLFFAKTDNWGLIFAIRTGSAQFSHKILATHWVSKGYHSANGYITRGGRPIPTPEEKDVFALAGILMIPPEARELPSVVCT